MLLNTYKLEIVNSECMPRAMGVLFFAHLDQEVTKAIPFNFCSTRHAKTGGNLMQSRSDTTLISPGGWCPFPHPYH